LPLKNDSFEGFDGEFSTRFCAYKSTFLGLFSDPKKASEIDKKTPVSASFLFEKKSPTRSSNDSFLALKSDFKTVFFDPENRLSLAIFDFEKKRL